MVRPTVSILLLALLLPLFADSAVSASDDPLFELVEYRSDMLDLNNDDDIDRVRVVFVISTTLSQTQVSAKVIAQHGRYEVSQWDNFTVTHNASESRSILVDAWEQGIYDIQLQLFDAVSGELVADIQIGGFDLMVGLAQPYGALNVVAISNGRTMNDGFRTGDDCTLLRTHHDAIGNRYDLSGTVQFLGAPWLVAPLEASGALPSSDQIDCSEWPAGEYTLLLVYRNSLGHSLEVWNNFTILNQPAPEFTLNVTGDADEIGTTCAVIIEPTDAATFNAARVDWEIEPSEQGVGGMQVDCTMWLPGVHRIVVKVANSEGITATEGFNLVRIPPLDGDLSQWGDETVRSTWPVRSGEELETAVGGYIATAMGMLILFFVTLLILRRFGEGGSQGFELMNAGPNSDGLPTHLDEEGHLWRQHPNGEIDWWDSAAEMWMPFQ